MSRPQPPFARPLFSYENAFKNRYAAGNLFAEDRAVVELWRLIEPLAQAIDALKPMGRTGQRERPLEIRRSTLFKMGLAARLLGKGPQQGVRRVQTSPVLRNALGLPALTAETMELLRRALGGQDVPEPGVPSRQLLADFYQRWLVHYGGYRLIEDFTYVDLPYMIGVELGADYSAVAVDSKMAPSPRRHTETDDVMGIGRKTGPIRAGTPGRLAHGVIACKDLPVILGGDLIDMAESPWVREIGIPTVAERARIMEERLRRHGLSSGTFLTAKETTWVGDGPYCSSPTTLAAMSAGHRVAFRLPEWPSREILMTYTASPEGMADISVPIEIATGGVCYCSCDAETAGESTPLHERIPMAQYVGKSGPAGFNFYACERASCPWRGVRVKVHFSAVRLANGDPNYAVVTQMPRADKRTEAINFKGQQAIEQRNGLLAELKIAKKVPDRDFVLTGALSCRYQLLLTHIVANARILLNGRAGILDRTEFSWADAFDGAIRKNRQIFDRTKSVDEEGRRKEYPKLGSLFYPLPEERPERQRIREHAGAYAVRSLRPEHVPSHGVEVALIA